MILVCFRWIVLVFLLGARGQVFQVPKVLQQFGNMASDTAGGAFQVFNHKTTLVHCSVMSIYLDFSSYLGTRCR